MVGETGAGKSTLVSLMPRFYDPTGGRVLLDGIDVREFQLRALRQQVAMVLQQPLVFPTTVRENIAYGQPDASAAQIARGRPAGAARRFPGSPARGPGHRRSASRARRCRVASSSAITIARAILREAPLLILDEPTAALDATTEARVLAGLEQLMEGRTSFVIAHRLSTVRRADVILVLDEGRILEQGSFNELVARGGHFARLHQTQFGLGEEERAATS